MAVAAALGVASPAAAQSPAPMGTATPPSTPARAGGGTYALNTAIECHRRGEYELAANWFQQAQKAEQDLNEAQRTDLSIWVQLNASNTKARREGSEALRKADLALKAGRTQEAQTLLQEVALQQRFLTATDKQLYSYLEAQVRPPSAPGRPSAAVEAPAAVVRTTANTERPAPTTASAATSSGTGSRPQADNALKGGDVARQLMKQARQALQAGDLTVAMKLATEARAYKADLNWWDDNPDKLVTEIQRVEAARKTMSPPNTVQTENRAADPRTLVKKARELFQAGNLTEAEQTALEANAAGRSVRWGLFEETPDKLLTEIRKATQRRDQEESVRVLAEARRTYEQAKGDPQLLAKALDLTNRAERLHGPYGLLDTSDKPHKLRAEIEAMQARNLRQGIPAVPTATPSTAVVHSNQNQSPRPTVDSAMRQASHTPAPVALPPPVAPPVMPLPQDNRVAQAPLPPVSPVPQVPPPTLTPAPQVTAPSVPPPVAQPPVAQQPITPPPMAPVVDANKNRALLLLDEARRHQKDGRLIEARKAVVDAQNLKAGFRPDEEGPDKVILMLSAQANRQVDSLMIQANDLLASAGADPSKVQKAEACLMQARQLSTEFGFDTQPVDARLASLKKPAQPVVVTQAPAAPQPLPVGDTPKPADASKSRGEELLRQARLELNKGQTGNARRLAVEAFSGNFGVQVEAEKVLRTVDAEEFNQRILAAGRSYDAGVSALQRQDSTQALMIFRTIEPSLLPPEKQTKLKELVAGLDPQHAGKVATQTPPVQGTAPTTVAAPSPVTPVKGGGGDETYAQQVKALQDVKYQQLREEGLRIQREAMDRFQAGDTDRALEMLDDHLAALRDAQMDAGRIAMLRRPVEMRAQQFKTLKAQRDFEKLQANQRNLHSTINQKMTLAEDNKNKQLTELMNQYRTLYKEGKYREAEMYAMRAAEIDPDNAQVSAAIATARIQRNQTLYTNIKKEKEDFYLQGLDDAEKVGPSVTSLNPIQFDPATRDRIKDRKPMDFNIGGLKNEKEREIQRRLHTPVNLEFKDTSLEKAIDDLQEMTGINIHLHKEALREAGIKADQPVSIKVGQVSLESALKILLKDVGLTHHIENEVLNITTERHARGKLVTRTIPVADLVLPVENYSLPSRDSILRAGGTGQLNNVQTGGLQPHLGRNAMQGGTDVSPATLGSHAMSSTPSGNANGSGWQKHGSRGTIEDLLIKLITNTISPQSWSDMGGPGTIDYYPLGMALIINQTPDIQEQIAELLQALRRLQDQEVAVEVRFVTIAESFFERIGLDFNVNFKTNNTRYEPQIVTQQFKPFGYINDFQPKNAVIGLTPAGSFTSDLDIPIKTSSFGMAVPPFGAFPNIPGGNGGLELGLAFLSDIQVFLFMEAAQGDQRTNVMQAPKLTLFNGQTATISIEDQQYFVTNVTAVQTGGQIVFTPTNQLLPIGGVSLTIQAVISADRRFVRMSLTPLLTNVASAIVQLYPITTFIIPVFEGGAQGQPVPFTQFLQQPVFNTISVQTTVAVPDGGTVLLGGLKRLSEGRNEFGPPILSKLPYINRLFKNVGYGREAESLMMMVTPRIIINEEEEEKFNRQNPPVIGQALPDR